VAPERYGVSVQFRILGPVEIETDGGVVSLPRRRERCLLGVLLLEANRVVSVDRLAELLWDDEPPKRVRGAVQGHVSRLRAALAGIDGAAAWSWDTLAKATAWLWTWWTSTRIGSGPSWTKRP
jgi:hypothetical protein